ncbi:MAG: hypothetical protein COA99_10010 [Moraxellaceae bacterium]|nr:MAG: hypothetical protein COA99_10010 [Moraxellaceae bacterium]
MADLNLLDFYKDTAKILLQLHRSFPRKVEVYVEDFVGADHVDEFGLHSKRHESCFGAMLWLAEEGYIRYQSTIRQEAIDQSVLTSKTVVLLNTISRTLVNEESPENNDLPPFEANEKFTMIEHIRQALKSQSSEQLTIVMRSFMGMS